MTILKYDEILQAILAELEKPNVGIVEWKELENTEQHFATTSIAIG